MNPNDYAIHLWCEVCWTKIGVLVPTPPAHKIASRIEEALTDHAAEKHTGLAPVEVSPRHEIKYEPENRQPWAVYYKGALVSREYSESAAMLYVAGAHVR